MARYQKENQAKQTVELLVHHQLALALDCLQLPVTITLMELIMDFLLMMVSKMIWMESYCISQGLIRIRGVTRKRGKSRH